MKKVLGCVFLILSMTFLNGCSPFQEYSSQEDEKNPSSLGTVRSVLSFAQIERQIACFSDGNASIHILDNQGHQEKILERPYNRVALEITAGEEYFYVYCSADEVYDEELRGDGYLRIYDRNARLLKEVLVPFTRVNVKDGILYGYFDGSEEFSTWISNIANSHIEATHYIEEDKFLDSFPNQMADWNKITGGEEVTIANHHLYRCSADYYHKTNYYSDRKPLSVFGQVDYILYCDGRLSSEEYDTEIKPRMGQIYGMMREKEKHFLIRSFQDGDKIYGICNVYHSTGGFLTFFTKDIDYSFSFQYDEEKDELYKVNEYNGIELVYENDKNCLYHELDGIYCLGLQTGMKGKIYDSDGTVQVTILDDYVRFQDDSEDSEENQSKQVFKKMW